jgi:cytochrome c oxidase subunit 4
MSQPAVVRSYLGVFLALMLLTALTVWAAFQHFGIFNDLIALGIATTKATLVVLFFMHLKHSTPLAKIAILAAVGFFLLLIVFLFADIWTRGLFESATGLVERP